jgi:hypothetical protein
VLPSIASPSSNEDPFFCLLENDYLVTDINIQTAQLLEAGLDDSEVVLLIKVRTKATQQTWRNAGHA